MSLPRLNMSVSVLPCGVWETENACVRQRVTCTECVCVSRGAVREGGTLDGTLRGA